MVYYTSVLLKGGNLRKPTILSKSHTSICVENLKTLEVFDS